MAKIKESNIDLFGLSLKNPEPLVDNFYIKSGGLIISTSPQAPTQLTETNTTLLENITSFGVAKQTKNQKMMDDVVNTVRDLVTEKGINFSEFVSFWSVMDVSYSAYKSLPKNEQVDFIRAAIEKYVEMRHKIFSLHGYSTTTLQVSKDAKSHKSSGSLGIKKAASILENFGYKKPSNLDITSFEQEDDVYILTDKTGKKLFNEMLDKYHIDFQWSRDHENKKPDILFKHKGCLYIVEHKHMKEGGGGQDKQITEVLNFINYNERHSEIEVHYITFLDGRYFNMFTKRNINPGSKLGRQLAKIEEFLRKNPGNYFLNTAGFTQLLQLIR